MSSNFVISAFSGCIVDTHCFYLLGKITYDEYQRQAAERFVSVEQEGLFCPRVECGAAFLWEFDPSDNRVRKYVDWFWFNWNVSRLLQVNVVPLQFHIFYF